MSRQFNRPVEFDPQLAQQAKQQQQQFLQQQQHQMTPQLNEKLKSEFGFEEDEDQQQQQQQQQHDDAAQRHNNASEEKTRSAAGSSSSTATLQRSPGGEQQRVTQLLAQQQAEARQLAQQLQQQQQQNTILLAQRNEQSEIQSEMERVSKQKQQILMSKFKSQLAVLDSQLQEARRQLSEDDDTIEALTRANAKHVNIVCAAVPASSGNDASAAAPQTPPSTTDEAQRAQVLSLLDGLRAHRELERENSVWRFKQDELQAQLQALKDELELVRSTQGSTAAAAAAASAALLNSSSTSIGSNSVDAAMQQRVQALESERDVFRTEIQKRTVERQQLQDTIRQLQQTKGVAAAAPVAAPAVAAVAAGVASPLAAEERAKLQAQIAALQSQVATAAAAASVATSSAASSTASSDQTVAQLQQLNLKITQLTSDLTARDTELVSTKEKAREKLTIASDAIKKLKTEYMSLKAQFTKLRSDNTNTVSVDRTQIAQRKQTLNTIQQKLKQYKQLIAVLKKDANTQLTAATALVPQLTKQLVTRFNQELAQQANSTVALTKAYAKEIALRKSLFNQLQELKGNIRVYARCRPLAPREVAEAASMSPTNASSSGSLSTSDAMTCSFSEQDSGQLRIENSEKKQQYAFEFERVFTPHSTQQQVFDEIKDLITSVMDGYNTCIFAYGQTGSGKTHTMQGTASDPGVNVRALNQLFVLRDERKQDYEYSIRISLLEVYNEKLQDLLSSISPPPACKFQNTGAGMEVIDLTMVSVDNSVAVLAALAQGSKNRRVTSTAMNDASSRSHLVLTVYVTGKNRLTGRETQSKMNLIDLAGSERTSKSQVTGEAMKEAQAINTSLSALGNVISARANKSAHVPYRDSTLTHLLQSSLEKDSKTLMFVQISPARSDVSESVCSLKFAERVAKVELGKASINTMKKDLSNSSISSLSNSQQNAKKKREGSMQD